MGDWLVQTALYLIGIMAAFNFGLRKGQQKTDKSLILGG